MAANQMFLFCDTGTYANFSNWASAFSTNLTTFGWSQTNDTGQVMWSGMSITAVAMSGTTMTCTYSSQTGLALAVGRALTVTGWTGGNTGNNGTFVITGGTLAAGSGTFTAINASGVNVASGGTGVVTIQSTVPTAGNYVAEIWTPNDGGTAFYLKLEYGSGTVPHIRGTMSSSTNGASGATGFITTAAPWDANVNGAAVPSTTATYECNFSGGPGRFTAMMWRNSPNLNQVLISIERGVNSSGNYVNSGAGAHVTYMQTFSYNGTVAAAYGRQQSLVFGVGMGPVCSAQTGVGNSNFGFIVRCFLPNNAGAAGLNSTAFNGSMSFDTVTPAVGFFDYPLTSVGVVYAVDIAEAVPFTTTLYGSTRTYIPSKSGIFASTVLAGQAVCMRYD